MNKVVLLLCLFLFSWASFAQAPQPEHPGVQQYEQGKYGEAASTLSMAVKDKYWKTNPELWNYLGLAYIGTNDFKKARKALEKAVDLQPASSNYHTNLAFVDFLLLKTDEAITQASNAISLDTKNVSAYHIRGMGNLRQQKLDSAQKDAEQMIATDKTDARGYLLSFQIIMARLEKKLIGETEPTLRANLNFLTDARDVLRRGAELSRNDSSKTILAGELESAEAFCDILSKEPRKPADPPEAGVTPLKMLAKPRAPYTEKARSNNVSGTIRAVLLLGADAQVKYILLLNRLGYGLDEEVVRAARAVKFEPKKKDGKPVPSVVTMEYSFTIY
jgi:tetratricopeptide (TPR) repeat protein